MRGDEEDRVAPTLARWSRIEFHPTSVQRQDDGEPLLGCPRATAWLVVDDDALRIFDALKRKASVERAEEWLRETTGEEYDAEDFARLLLARGFVRAIDGIALDPHDQPGRQHRIVFRAPGEALRRLHHPFVLAFFGTLAAAWFVLVALWWDLLPRPSHLLLTQHPAVNLILAFVAGTFFVAVHEAGHYLMARSYGIDARVRLSHRLYLLVVETDCTNAWILKPRQRIHVFFAGIAVDLVLGAACAMGVLLVRSGAWEAPGLVAPLLFLQFLAVVPVAYQLLFFAKTDLYYVLLAALGERRLVDDAKAWVRLQAHRLGARRRVPCDACGRAVAPAEPYCAACLAPRPEGDAERFPILPEQHRRLALFSAILFPGGAIVAAYALVTSFVIAWQQGALGLAILDEGLARASWLLVMEGVASVAIAALGVGLVLFFVARDLLRWSRRVWRARPRATPRSDGS